MSIDSLVRMTDAAFHRGYFENGQGFFSPRSGDEISRGTGYAVAVAKPLVLDTDQSRGPAFVQVVEFVNEHFTSDWATGDPLYMTVASAPAPMHFSIYLAVQVVNDLHEAFTLADRRGVTTVWGFTLGRPIPVPVKSTAAVNFTSSPAVSIDGEQMVYRDGRYVSAEGSVLIRDLPGLQDNPWNTPYVRTHL